MGKVSGNNNAMMPDCRGRELNIAATDDVQLLHRIAVQDDRNAFEELYRRYAKPGYSVALRITKNTARAEEALQEGLFHVWRSAQNYRQKGSVFSWIVTIVAREAMALSTKENQASRKAARLDLKTSIEGKEGYVQVENSECRTALKLNMNQLSKLERRLMALYFGGGLSQDEIAKSLNIPQRTVSYRIKSALQQLRKAMAHAGFTSLSAIVLKTSLNKMICSGFAPPPGSLQSILIKIQSATNDSSIENSISPKTLYWTGLPLALAALGLTLVVFQISPEPVPLKANTAAQLKATSKLDTASSINQGLTESPQLQRTWDFKTTVPTNWTTRWAPIKWTIPTEFKQGRLVPEANKFALLELDFPLENRPHRIRISGTHLDSQSKVSKFGVQSGTLYSIPSSQNWVRQGRFRLMLSNRFKVDYFCFDNYYVHRQLPSNKITHIGKFQKAYPGNRLYITLKDVSINKIELTSLTREELPREFKNMSALINKMNVPSISQPERWIVRNPNKN